MGRLHSSGKVKVTVDKGWVTLDGVVDWQYQRLDAERVVRRLTGVRGVSNQIQIKPQAPPMDLKRKIEEALVRSAETDAQRINVETASRSPSSSAQDDIAVRRRTWPADVRKRNRISIARPGARL